VDMAVGRVGEYGVSFSFTPTHSHPIKISIHKNDDEKEIKYYRHSFERILLFKIFM
jgi:hypothetical protein